MRCILNLVNWSMFTLMDVETNTECGETNKKFPPRNIFPGHREVIVMHNTNPMIGTCGTISWKLGEINLRLMIMWSVPFNFNIRDSYFAIGLTHNKVSTFWKRRVLIAITYCRDLFLTLPTGSTRCTMDQIRPSREVSLVGPYATATTFWKSRALWREILTNHCLTFLSCLKG